MRVKTPDQLTNPGKTKISLTLDTLLLEEVRKRAAKANISSSKIVDEALRVYLTAIKEK